MSKLDELRTLFLKKHGELTSGDSSSFFKKSNLDEKISLRMVLVHAIDNEKKSRETCVQLGWLNSDGELADSAPLEIRNLYDQLVESNQQILDGITTKTALNVIRMGMIKNSK